MLQETRQTDDRPIFEPIAPGLALRIIFEKNMGMSLENVSINSGISLSTLHQIAYENKTIDEKTADKLIEAFGETGTTLVRLQFLYDFFQKNRHLPRFEEIYSI